MKHYVVFVLLIISVQCMSNPRITRQADDYDDGMGFNSNGRGGDDDFIANSSSCPAGMTRAPWGACIACYEYRQKFGHAGNNC
ncbi:unnamed protein product [Pieris macdunnoughi]|uniref:Uncharacterized protein n=1 Tax=Pieris macdunnoughi TaxID=345717 RepID=A0A821RF55_9NEOP|nr:unnamed protein product [Pieris macdunnoughi]